MKKLLVLASATAFLFTACVSNPDGEKAETTEASEVASGHGTAFTVNTAASTVEWHGKKVTGQHHGTVAIKSGTLSVHDGKLTGGNVVLDLTTINDQDMEGESKQKLEGHLKSADFFDVENHPEATLEITEVTETDTEGVVTISANLTIRGVTKNITFDANVSEASEAAFKASADFNIEREQWGVSYTGKADDLISKEINLKVNLDAVAAI